MVKLADVAARAGVSASIASRVLNDDRTVRVRPETRRRLRAIADQLGYEPNPSARSLRMSRSGIVAVLLPEVTDPIFAEVFQGIHERARRTGIRAVYDAVGTYEKAPDLFRELMERGHVDGFVIQLADESRIQDYQRLIPEGTCCVFLQAEATGATSVLLDDHRAGYRATSHLLERGHRRIGFIGNLRGNQFGDRRYRGYAAALHEHGLRVRRDWVSRIGNRVGDGDAALTRIADSAASRPSAVVVASVAPAFGVLHRAHERAIRIPDDLSVLAIHDSPLAEYSIPPLTTLRMPLRQLGALALQKVETMLAGRATGTETIRDPAPELIDRRSVRPVPGA